MCGIAGIVADGNTPLALVDSMIAQLEHRGPDDSGTWIDRDCGIALGHRRLSIVDLSPAGHQPMVSADGRWVFSYNGEIYNHQELRRELEAAGLTPTGGWNGNSDTETLLQFIACNGLRAAIDRAVGMFAFALWDRVERRLSLGRDRFGEKPLYYGWVERDFLFGSELKAITAHPRFERSICREAVETFVARTYIPAPLSIYRRIFKLPPGCILEIDRGAASIPLETAPSEGRSSGGLRLTRYWDYAAMVGAGHDDPITDEEEALAQLEAALGQAIRGQAVADVPVGVFLSGGIDSATVTSLYQKYSSRPVRSFTIGFAEDGFDESSYAQEIASYLGTDHNQRYVTPADAMAVMPSLARMFDEPFADSSQIPTFLVSLFAREQVTVALSGDGGDELLGGYTRYGDASRLWGALRHVPLPLRAAAAKSLSVLSPTVWNGAATLLRAPSHRRLGSRMQKALRVGGKARSFEDVYVSLLLQWPFEASPLGADDHLSGRGFDFGGQWPDITRAMYNDATAYLPDDILCKVDRCAMAVSLETRVPFLDHRVAQVASRIPLSLKRRGSQGKIILRKLLGREIPSALFDRPKSGFALPIGKWLRGPLREWAEDLLDPGRMSQESWFDSSVVQARWHDHLSGDRHSGEALWAILMFQSWLRETPAGNPPVAVAPRLARG